MLSLHYISCLRYTILVRNPRYVTFFNPTTEVVTFRLHGWCMLCVFLLQAFAHLEPECPDLLSLCDGMHVCTDYTSVYTQIWKFFWRMESEPIVTPREKFPLMEKFCPEEDRTHDSTSSRTAGPTNNQWAIPAPSLTSNSTLVACLHFCLQSTILISGTTLTTFHNTFLCHIL